MYKTFELSLSLVANVFQYKNESNNISKYEVNKYFPISSFNLHILCCKVKIEMLKYNGNLKLEFM